MKFFAALVGFLLLGSAAHGNIAPYRFQALIDRDRLPGTGCDAETPAGVVHGSELRVSARTDRQVLDSVTSEICVDGAWQVEHVDTTPHPLELGRGRLSSDRFEFALRRELLTGSGGGELRLFSESSESGAYDVLGTGDEFATLRVPFGGGVVSAPALAPWGLALLVGVLLLAARRRLRSARATAALLVAFAMCSLFIPQGIQAGLGGDGVILDDRANDSVGLDAAIDLLGVSIIDDADGVRVRIEVNNFEADGLPDGARVLFIGNSLTYENDLPSMLRAVAAQAGKTLITGEVTAPNFSLQDHYLVGDAQREIARGYQIVIMQQGPSSLQSSQTNLLHWTQNFSTLIRASGARPALYMVWPELARINVFDEVQNSYSNAALAVDGMFLPGGEAWLASWAIDPTLALYGPDEFHPSTLGTYAVALAIFAELYRQTPLDLPTNLAVGTGAAIQLNPTAARVAQQGAWQAHLQYGRAGH